jgi:hypothetical protein
MSIVESTPDSPTMAAPVAKQVSLELAEKSQPDLLLQAMGKPPSLSSQPVGLEQEQVPVNNGGKAKKPLSFYMTFLALNICVLLVSLDATALAVAVPVSSTPPAI